MVWLYYIHGLHEITWICFNLFSNLLRVHFTSMFNITEHVFLKKLREKKRDLYEMVISVSSNCFSISEDMRDVPERSWFSPVQHQ